MLVAYNMARWRRVTGMTQEQLGERLGWTNVAVSAAERSWDGRRVRQFDADLITALAAVLRVPVPAFFMPPADDGETVRYAIAGGNGPVPVAVYFTFVLPDPDLDPSTPAGAAYAAAVITAVARYSGTEAAAGLSDAIKERASAEELKTLLSSVRDNGIRLELYRDLAGDLAVDNAILTGAIERALEGRRTDRSSAKPDEEGGSS
jgi:transcriptional regulator with XRE-family HTH domain